MFKSKEEKLIEQRMAVKRTMDDMQRYIAELEPKKQTLIAKVKQAAKSGAKSQEHAAKAALKQVLAQQRFAEKMLMNFEVMVTMRDVTEISGRFLQGMKDMSKQMGKLTSSLGKFSSVEKDLQEAMVKSQTQTARMNEFLEKMSGIMDDGLEDVTISDTELDAIVYDATAESEEDSIDKEIEDRLKALDDKLKS